MHVIHAKNNKDYTKINCQNENNCLLITDTTRSIQNVWVTWQGSKQVWDAVILMATERLNTEESLTYDDPALRLMFCFLIQA